MSYDGARAAPALRGLGIGNVGRIRGQKLIRSGVALAPGQDVLVGGLSWPGVEPAPDVERCWQTMRRPAWGRGGAPVAAARLPWPAPRG